jgi:hypothetical protein
MGDRANVYVKDFEEGSGTYLYSHWGGTELPEVVQTVLAKRARWDDNPYLARMIFSEMVKDDIDGETGYGISATVGDGDDRVLVVDPNTQTIWREGSTKRPLSFEQYVSPSLRPDWDVL